VTADVRAWLRRLDETKHHPELLTAGRHGAWCNCSCGWRSETYRSVTGAHLAFGEHLRAAVAAPLAGHDNEEGGR
jgi:hypothetical protein